MSPSHCCIIGFLHHALYALVTMDTNICHDKNEGAVDLKMTEEAPGQW